MTKNKRFIQLLLTIGSAICLCSCKKEVVKEEVIQQGTITGKVLSSNGDMMIAGIIIEDEEHNYYRTTTNEYGGYLLKLNPGKYTLTFTKGYEFSTYSTEIEIESLKTYRLRDTRLSMQYDSYAKGWIGGDLHQHTYYSDGQDSPVTAMIQNAASNCYFGFLTDHNTSLGVPEWREGNVKVYRNEDGTDRYFTCFAGSEVTTSFGHFNSLGTGMTFDKYEIEFRTSESSSTNVNGYAREKMIYVADQIKRQGYVAQMNHPYSITNMGAMNYIEPTDYDLLNHFDTIEIWNAYFTVPDGRFTTVNSDNQNLTSKNLWYSSLNNVKNGGKFIAATSGTDNHDGTGYVSGITRQSLNYNPTKLSEYQNLCRYGGKFAGCVQTYINLLGKDLTQDNVLDAVTKGHSFLSNGPILNCTVNGKIFGETVEATSNKVTFKNDIYCQEGISEVRFVKNGEIIKSISLDDVKTFTNDVTLDNLNSNDWVLIEVLGDFGVYAISNPVFIA